VVFGLGSGIGGGRYERMDLYLFAGQLVALLRGLFGLRLCLMPLRGLR
jgi:hypothetical protein